MSLSSSRSQPSPLPLSEPSLTPNTPLLPFALLSRPRRPASQEGARRSSSSLSTVDSARPRLFERSLSSFWLSLKLYVVSVSPLSLFLRALFSILIRCSHTLRKSESENDDRTQPRRVLSLFPQLSAPNDQHREEGRNDDHPPHDPLFSLSTTHSILFPLAVSRSQSGGGGTASEGERSWSSSRLHCHPIRETNRRPQWFVLHPPPSLLYSLLKADCLLSAG